MGRLIRTQLESSSIASLTYDPEDGTLEVEFRRTGHVYRYFDVPRSLHGELLRAESKGAFLNQMIKPNYEYVRADIPLG